MLNSWFTDTLIIQGHAAGFGIWGDVGGWTDKAVVLGRMRVLENRERRIVDKGTVEASHRFYLPFGTDITEKDRIFFEGRYYYVFSVRDLRDKLQGRYTQADGLYLEGREEYIT